jgi:hypothetical protein
MAQRRTLNERRLTRRQVAELIATEARPRDDLTAALDLAVLEARVYQLSGDRFMLVFGGMSGLSGKGDIYAADVFERFMRWSAKVDEDARHGRQSSTGHWSYYSPLKEQLITNIDRLVAELRSRMSGTADALDLSYKSLDVVSEYMEGIGVERAQRELYDHLVAYVGEVVRLRIDGRWAIKRDEGPPFFPYLVAEKYDPVCPVNVVWHDLSGYEPVNLRANAANEVRRKRIPGVK